jgi:tetrapyrrole methylase family protein / MazG family protein
VKITVVGLGPGPYSLLSREAAQVLEDAPKVWARTSRHPTVQQFPPSIQWASLDHVYDRSESFQELYRELASEVMAIARAEGEIVYAVPGDPSVAEDSVREVIRRAEEEGASVRIVAGTSFIEAVLAAVRTTMSKGLQLFDAAHVASANPLVDLLVYQIEDRYVASDVKLELLRKYPADHPVVAVRAAGVPADQRVQQLSLHEMDRTALVDHLTSLYVPASTPERAVGSFDSLMGIVARLRAPGGCPWDREQTHESLKPYVVEEAYEVVQAIDQGDPATLSEELGDLLLQVLIHAQIASESQEFDVTDVVAGIATKMVRRHPHVFGEVAVSGSREVLANWETIKRAEKAEGEQGGMFSGIPSYMPALQAAQEVQGRAARVGFDWEDAKDVLAKVAEEVEEIGAADTPATAQAEFGDVLFSLVNAARHMGINAEMALRDANGKFVERFGRMEEMARQQGVDFASLDLAQQDELWNRVKREEELGRRGIRNHEGTKDTRGHERKA